MDIEKLRQNERQFLALSSLYPCEFEELLSPFSARWRQFFKYRGFGNKRRIKPLTAKQLARSTVTLPTDADKLFFILYFFKNNPLQESLAAQFDINQGQVSRWIKILLPILEQSIQDLHLQPAGDIAELARLFRCRKSSGQTDAQSLHIDATERPIQRSTDTDVQRCDYSGKQGNHTGKNTVLCDEYQFVHYHSKTYWGSIHDKTMAQQDLPQLDFLQLYQLWLSKDKGFQGYRPSGVHLLEPFKASRNHPLTHWQKVFNQWISSIRIVCEHAICGIKRCRVIKDTLRYFDLDFRDRIFHVACGLHNLRVCRRPSYAYAAAGVRARINLDSFYT